MEAELVGREQVPFTSIPSAGVHGVGLRALPGNIIRLARGVFASQRILREFRPDVILFTGGYVAVPMAVAARRIPTLLYVPDIEPGLALKVLARFADCIGLTLDESKRYFPSNRRTVVTGYPTRPELQPMDRSTACQVFGLSPDLPVIGIFGGSSGARSINRAVLALLNELLPDAQILHVTGKLDWEEVRAAREQLSPELAARYAIYPYLHEEMAAAFSAADLAVSRAGASTLGEYPLFGLPAVLVPYPYAWRYQRINADYLVSKNAALVLEDADLKSQLQGVIRSLLNNPQRLQQMRSAMRSMAQPQAAQRLADLARELAGQTTQKGNPASW